MSNPSIATVMEQSRSRFGALCEQHDLLAAAVAVTARSLSPGEAIGEPNRKDFPVVVGKERVVAATVLETTGHAFTDSPASTSERVRLPPPASSTAGLPGSEQNSRKDDAGGLDREAGWIPRLGILR